MLEAITAHDRPEMLYAWRGPSLLILDMEGRSGTGEFQGYFFREARLLRDLRLEVRGEAPFVSAIARVAPNEIAVTYVHPKVPLKGVGSGTGGMKETDGLLQRDLDLYLRYRVRPASVEAVLEIPNWWQETVEVDLAWALSADSIDIDGAKPAGKRKQGAPVATEAVENGAAFQYQQEKLLFETRVAAEGGGTWSFADGRLSACLSLERQKTVEIRLVARAVEDDGGVRGDFTQKAKKRSYYQEMAAHPVASPLGAAAVLGLAALATGKARDKGVLAGLLALGAMGMSGKGALSATYKE